MPNFIKSYLSYTGIYFEENEEETIELQRKPNTSHASKPEVYPEVKPETEAVQVLTSADSAKPIYRETTAETIAQLPESNLSIHVHSD